jgi:hypothetical protein
MAGVCGGSVKLDRLSSVQILTVSLRAVSVSAAQAHATIAGSDPLDGGVDAHPP